MKIRETFENRKKNGQKALVTYIVSGDYGYETTKENIRAMVKAGADVIEIGIPFSDPIAEGVVIQEASQHSLAGGTTLKGIFQMVKELREEIKETPFVMMMYPNMIFAVALPYSPLTRMQKRAVVDIVTKELLTPKGLRSLSPKSEGYRPYYVGPQYERDLAYHQGTAWPWLLGAYLEAYLRVFGKSGVAFAERMLISLEEEMSLHCIGTIPELFDGNPPFTGRGAVSFAMNVAAILRVVDLLKKYNAE